MAAPQESKTVFYGPHVRVVTSTEVFKAKHLPVASPVPHLESRSVRMSTDLRAGQVTQASTHTTTTSRP